MDSRFQRWEKRGILPSEIWKSILKSIWYRNQIPLEILVRGRLLVNSNKGIALLWVPKSGSTFAVKWFFNQLDLLDEALIYHSSVHKFRTDIYRISDMHRESLASFFENPSNYYVIKVVRNPLKRAVSSYVHANRFGFADKEISKVVGREITSQERFSFREFVSYLDSVNINKCNIHCRPQVDPYEQRGIIKVDRIIDLEHAVTELRHLEMEFNLKNTNLENLARSRHHTKRTNEVGFCGDTKYFFYRKKKNMLPQTKYFYDENILRRICQIYAEDFNRYGYRTSLDDII